MTAPVTDHAVIRYCERVLNLQIAPVLAELGRDAAQHRLARRLCEINALDIDTVRQMILPVKLWPIVRARRLKSIRCASHTCLVENGTVTTVIRKRRLGRLKQLSNRENRREAQRADRRTR